MKKVIKYLPVLLGLFSLTSCLHVKQLEVKQIESVQLISMNDSIADLAVALKVYNPNKMKIHVKDCDLDAFLNHKYVGKVNLNNRLLINKKSENTQVVILKANMNQIKKIMPSLIFSNKALINLQGNIRVKAKGITKNLNVNIDQKVSRKDLSNINLVSAQNSLK